jgi:ParB-like chromosome segregation protein Spo0J
VLVADRAADSDYEKNSRKIPERAIDKVAASIKEFGFRQCIVVDGTMS